MLGISLLRGRSSQSQAIFLPHEGLLKRTFPSFGTQGQQAHEGHRGNTSFGARYTSRKYVFDATVTGQWSSPSGCPDLLSISSPRSVFCFVLRSKISLILLVIGEFDVRRWDFNTQTMLVMNSGTGESFCVE